MHWGGSNMRPSILKLVCRWQCLVTEETGQNLVEFGLVVALVAFACMATMKSLVMGIQNEFATIVAVLNSAL
jgi:Flp pilus assembly pilin Flp